MSRRKRRIDDLTFDQIERRRDTMQSEEQREEEIKLANFRLILQNRHVRDLVWEILEYAEMYNVNPNCDNTVFYTEGRRDVGQKILLLLNSINVSLYPNMIREHLPTEEKDDE